MMFHDAAAFNQPLGSWDVGSVTDMEVRRRPPPALHPLPDGERANRCMR